jgi:hypothetical protein
MFFDLPTMPTRYRGFCYVIGWDRANRKRQRRGYVALVTDPKTGKCHSIGHGHTSVVQLGQFCRMYIDVIANAREGWQ